MQKRKPEQAVVEECCRGFPPSPPPKGRHKVRDLQGTVQEQNGPGRARGTFQTHAPGAAVTVTMWDAGQHCHIPWYFKRNHENNFLISVLLNFRYCNKS